MGQPSIVEVDYHTFLAVLRRATDANKKIEPSEKERWAAFVRQHNVPEAGMAVKAASRSMSGKTKSVIIDGAGKTDGLYIYSRDDLFCLKYDLGRD